MMKQMPSSVLGELMSLRLKSQTQCWTDMGDLIPSISGVDLDNFINYHLHRIPVTDGLKVDLTRVGKYVLPLYIVGPAGTGKSYLLKGLIELAKSKSLN